LEYSGQSPTALEFSSDVFVVNSFSKYFGMTGWRVGWAIVPEQFTEQAERLAQNLFISASTPGQYAALAALSPDCREELERRRRLFGERRDFLMEGLRRLGFGLPAHPEGSFYIYADCSAFTRDSSDLALRILEDVGVAITPGKDFGAHFPEKFVRFSYTTSIPRLSEAIIRLRQHLAGGKLGG
jgi:aspartate/methionine/tyrosine aminotransferase